MCRHSLKPTASSGIMMLLTACASIVSDNEKTVSINSRPQQAEIVITDENRREIFRGTTPTRVTLDTSDGYFDGQEYTIQFSKRGYDPYTITVDSRMNGWYAGNIVFGGLVGLLIVDPLTGAMWTLETDYLDVALQTSVA